MMFPGFVSMMYDASEYWKSYRPNHFIRGAKILENVVDQYQIAPKIPGIEEWHFVSTNDLRNDAACGPKIHS